MDEFPGIADQAISGDTAVLDPYDAGFSDLNRTATCLNGLYDECEMPKDPEAGARIHVIIAPAPENEAIPEEVDGEVVLTAEVRVTTHPNPLTGRTTISYSLPAEGRVTVEVHDINGRRTADLVDAKKAAGTHGVVWNGRGSTGSAAAAGVYSYRVRLENHPTVMDKLIKL